MSILPSHLLPYWHVHASRLEAFANGQAEVGPGPDPPPDRPEAGALLRAWRRLAKRTATLVDYFGQLIAVQSYTPVSLWAALRRAKNSIEDILVFLGTAHKASLLGDYRCLGPD